MAFGESLSTSPLGQHIAAWGDQCMAQPTNSYQVTQTRAMPAIWRISSTGAMACLANSERMGTTVNSPVQKRTDQKEAELWIALKAYKPTNSVAIVLRR